mmetsp:Transcript_20095/g.35411  ORF Transcript_20095/g.35411 Transcript_20095/m.35411 type:complete len:116 (+) Transcript_20095:97-444(+)
MQNVQEIATMIPCVMSAPTATVLLASASPNQTAAKPLKTAVTARSVALLVHWKTTPLVSTAQMITIAMRIVAIVALARKEAYAKKWLHHTAVTLIASAKIQNSALTILTKMNAIT